MTKTVNSFSKKSVIFLFSEKRHKHFDICQNWTDYSIKRWFTTNIYEMPTQFQLSLRNWLLSTTKIWIPLGDSFCPAQTIPCYENLSAVPANYRSNTLIILQIHNGQLPPFKDKHFTSTRGFPCPSKQNFCKKSLHRDQIMILIWEFELQGYLLHMIM